MHVFFPHEPLHLAFVRVQIGTELASGHRVLVLVRSGWGPLQAESMGPAGGLRFVPRFPTCVLPLPTGTRFPMLAVYRNFVVRLRII